ncbi:MAG: ABC transporter permease, partial [Gemmobacter sp.]|nr:ABC transporter permease [Gemmobacter sp.]
MFDRLLSLLSWAVIIFLIAPLLVIIAASFTETDYVTFPPQGFTLKWYRELALQGGFFSAFVDSVIIAVATMAGAALIGIPTAFGLRMGSARAQAVLRTFVMSPLTLPGIVTGVALLQLYYAANLDAPLAGIIVGHILVTLPFFVRTLGAGLEALDPSILEAAESLGATRIRVFVRVLLPTVLPSICAGLAFVFITSFDEVTMSIF